jgi:hypothetical protein
MRVLVAVAFAGFVCGSAAAQTPAGTPYVLTDTELTQMMRNETAFTGKNELNQPFSTTYSPNGTVQGKSVSLGYPPHDIWDTGTWRINGNTLCQTWNRWRDGQESCASLTAIGAGTYRYSVVGQPTRQGLLQIGSPR